MMLAGSSPACAWPRRRWPATFRVSFSMATTDGPGGRSPVLDVHKGIGRTQVNPHVVRKQAEEIIKNHDRSGNQFQNPHLRNRPDRRGLS